MIIQLVYSVKFFLCRIGSLLYEIHILDQFKAVRFVGYLDSKHESNLKHNLISQKDCSLSQNHSTNLIESPNTEHGLVMFHYLIAYGKVEENKIENIKTEFISKLDIEGKILYSESW